MLRAAQSKATIPDGDQGLFVTARTMRGLTEAEHAHHLWQEEWGVSYFRGDLPPHVERWMEMQAIDRPITLPASLNVVDVGDMALVAGIGRDLIRRLKPLAKQDPSGWISTDIGVIEKMVPQNGRWPHWWIVPGEFHNTFVSESKYHAYLDVVLREVATTFPSDDEDIGFVITHPRLRGWPTMGSGFDDLECAIAAANWRWKEEEAFASTKVVDTKGSHYAETWTEKTAKRNELHKLNPELQGCFVMLTRTGPNRKERPLYEKGLKAPVCTAMGLVNRPRTRHVQGGSYEENIDDVALGYAYRHAHHNHERLSFVFSHGDPTSVANKVAQMKRRVQDNWRVALPSRRIVVGLTGLDVAGRDKAWTETDHDRLAASEEKYLPRGRWYKGSAWRRMRWKRPILGPGVILGSPAFRYDRKGYNTSGIGTTGDDNNHLQLAQLMCCIAICLRKDGFSVPSEPAAEAEYVWSLLGVLWSVLLKGDDTLGIWPVHWTDQIVELMWTLFHVECTPEEASFLASNVETGARRAARIFDAECGGAEHWTPGRPWYMWPIAQGDRVQGARSDPAFPLVWHAMRQLPLAFASVEDLMIARDEALILLRKDVDQGDPRATQAAIAYCFDRARHDPAEAMAMARRLGVETAVAKAIMRISRFQYATADEAWTRHSSLLSDLILRRKSQEDVSVETER